MTPTPNPKSIIPNLKWLPLAFGLLLLTPAARAAVTVSNVSAAQTPGTKQVVVTYDVASDATNAVTVSLVVSNGAAAVAGPSVTGAVGAGVATGTGRSIVWDMGADWNGQVSADLQATVTADDGAAAGGVPQGMVLIPAGTNSGTDPDFGAYSLTVDAFYMDATEVTKAQWDTVYTWAVANGYTFSNAGSGKATDHPVQTVSWYDCVKWCNARSQKEGRTPCYTVGGATYKTGQNVPDCSFVANGYRLPTNTEWMYAARGGASGHRFPWSSTDTIQHSRANYVSSDKYSYDTSPTRGFHPTYQDGTEPYTSPVRSFASNGYGLYDMGGNVSEWCWDASGGCRPLRGGSWLDHAFGARCGSADQWEPDIAWSIYGFRGVCR